MTGINEAMHAERVRNHFENRVAGLEKQNAELRAVIDRMVYLMDFYKLKSFEFEDLRIEIDRLLKEWGHK